jgi:3'-5' exoribonuclease
MKDVFMKDVRGNETIEGCFMIMKKLAAEGKNIIAIIGDKSGDIKASIPDKERSLAVGDVLSLKATKESILVVSDYSKEEDFDMEDFLPTVKKPIDDIMNELEDISKEEFKSDAAKALNEYFFNNEEFVRGFRNGIGGMSMHHNYIGGLAEHTLNVMYMAKVMAYRYDCRFKEIAILSAKLHDIGKTIEYTTEGPFAMTMRGDMEGHIVIGMTMLDEAFRAGGDIYSDDFKHRIRGCIVQHHGKLEYGSPKAPNTEEAYIVHYADYVDATMNKIFIIKENTQPDTWSDYDRRIGTRIYI